MIFYYKRFRVSLLLQPRCVWVISIDIHSWEGLVCKAMTPQDPFPPAQVCTVLCHFRKCGLEKTLPVFELREVLTCFWTLGVPEGQPKFNQWKIRLDRMKFKIQKTKKNPESSFNVGLQPITPAAASASEPRHCSVQWEYIPVTLSLPLPLWSGPFLSLLHLCQPFNVPLSTAMPLISHHLGATRCAFSWAAKCLLPLKKKGHHACDWLHRMTILQKDVLLLLLFFFFSFIF